MREASYGRGTPPTVLPNDRYGRLTVLSHAGSRGGKRLVLVRCDCGTEKVLRASALRSGNTTSCGCAHRELLAESNQRLKVKHGHATGGHVSPTYQSWEAMIARCTRPTHPAFANYGGRGITIYEPWRESFTAFLADMGERPDGKTLDRIDNDGNYAPGNCRWATPSQQTKNQRPRPQMTSCRHGHDPSEMSLRRDGRWYCKQCRREHHGHIADAAAATIRQTLPTITATTRPPAERENPDACVSFRGC